MKKILITTLLVATVVVPSVSRAQAPIERDLILQLIDLLQQQVQLLMDQLAEVKNESGDKTDEIEEESQEIIEIEVSFYSSSTFGKTGGTEQRPLAVGYKFTNNSDSWVSIDKISFDLDTYGGRGENDEGNWHYIRPGETQYTVSEKSRDKSNPSYIEDKHFIDHSTISIEIPADSSRIVYLNMWNFDGYLEDSSAKKGTIVTLNDVVFDQEDVELSLNDVVADIEH